MQSFFDKNRVFSTKTSYNLSSSFGNLIDLDIASNEILNRLFSIM